jgi:hypothetical protein
MTILLPLLAGSLLTWLIGLQMAVFNGRQTLAAALRAASRLLRSEAEAQVAGLSGGRSQIVPADDRLWRARADLATHLLQVSALRKKWKVPGKVAEELYDRAFMDKFTRARFDGDAAERRTAKDQVLNEVDELTERVESVARALQQPFRRHGAMRKAA